jgi:hypothetical protein
MNTDQPSPLPDSFREIAKTATIILAIATAAAFGLMGKMFHWLISIYSALLATPLLCMLWFRFKILLRVRFERLQWADAKRLYGWSILTFFSLLFFLHSLELLRGKWAYAQLQAELETNGQSLSWNNVIPPGVPDEDNFCAIPLLAALVDIPSNSNWMLGPAPPKSSPELERIMRISVPDPSRPACWSTSELPDFEQQRQAIAANKALFGDVNPTNSAPTEILKALTVFEPELRDLRQAMNRPDARWKLPYKTGWFVADRIATRDRALQKLMTLLSIQSSALLAMDDLEKAESAIMLNLRLTDTLREPMTWSLYFRMDYIQKALAPIWDGIAKQRWSKESLTRLQTRLDKIRLLDDADQWNQVAALECMTFWQGVDDSLAVGNLIKHYGALRESDREPLFWVGLLWTLHPRGWTYQNKVHAYRWFHQDPTKWSDFRNPMDPVNRLFIFPKYKAISASHTDRAPRYDRIVQQARVACALERYHLERDTYPESLESLTPAWMNELPKSESGEPLLGYRQTSNGRYLLYPADAKKVSEDFEPLDLRYRYHHDQNEFGDDVWRYPPKG